MISIVTNIEEINRVEWSNFVLNHPQGNIFQTPEMYDLYKVTNNYTPIVFVAINESKIVGVLLATIIVNGKSVINYLTKRSIITGGPLVLNNDDQITSLLIDAYNRYAKKYNVIYSQVRPIYNSDEIFSLLIKKGYKRNGHYNLMLDLTQTYDTLYSNLHKERKRNINQAEKAGLLFKEIYSDNDIQEISNLIVSTYKRKGVPLGYDDMFIKSKQILPNSVRFFAAYYDGKMIGGQIRLCYKDLVYAWFAGSDDEYLKKRPNDFLLWNVIKWSQENQYSIFDFGGGGEPGVPYGVRDYKLKYGCQMYDFGRLELHHKPLLYWLASTAYKLFHKIKGK